MSPSTTDGHLWYSSSPTKLVELPRTLRSGDVLRVTGKGAPATLDLRCGEKLSDGVVLHINPRRGQGCVVRNSYEAQGGWREEELGGGYPFLHTTDRWMYELVMNEGEVLMKADGGRFFASFSFRDGRRAGNVAYVDVQSNHRCHVGRSREVVLSLNRELDASAIQEAQQQAEQSASLPAPTTGGVGQPAAAAATAAASPPPKYPNASAPKYPSATPSPQANNATALAAAVDVADVSSSAAAPAPAPAQAPAKKKLTPKYPCPLPTPSTTADMNPGPGPAERKWSLTNIPLPKELPLVELALLLKRLVKEDSTHWFHMQRADLLARIELLGVRLLENREAIITAFRKHCDVLGFNPTPPKEPMPPPPPELEEDLPSEALVREHTPGKGRPAFENAPYQTPHKTKRIADEDAPPTISEAARSDVRRMLLIPSYGLTFDKSMEQVKYSYAREFTRQKNEDLEHYTKDFSECGGSGCGCYRLRWPWVRVSFRNLVVRKTVRQIAKAAKAAAAADGASAPVVRYVSIGCGSLLTDFEILCGLQMKGLTIETISLIDLEYRKVEPGNDPRGRFGKAIQALHDFFPRARVSAFGEMSALRQAALDFPDVYGRVTTMVRCDATGVPYEESKALAARLLVPGGIYFVQSNTMSTRKLQDGLLVKNGGVLNEANDELFNGMRECFVRDPIRRGTSTAGGEMSGGPSADAEGIDALRRVGWPADPFFASQLRRLPLKGIEGDGPLLTAAELASSSVVTDGKLYRIDSKDGAEIYEGDATRPYKTADRMVGTRKAGTYVLGKAPLKEDTDGVWVKVHRHDPHRFCDGWFGAAAGGGGKDEQWVRLAGKGDSKLVTEIDPRDALNRGMAAGAVPAKGSGDVDEIVLEANSEDGGGEAACEPCEPDNDDAALAEAEVEALKGLPTGGAPLLEDAGAPPPVTGNGMFGNNLHGGALSGASYNAMCGAACLGIH